MTPHYADDAVTLYAGDCLDVLRELSDASVDAVCTDPPYNLSFMSKPWDALVGQEDAGFAYWLAGLIDGEGHFAVKKHTRGTHAPYFQLKMRADERGTLEMVKRNLGVGTLTIQDHEPNPMAQYVIQDKAGCQRLVDLLDKYPLRAKKQIDYWAWREAVCEWTSRPRGNRWHGQTDNTRMAAIRGRLMENRHYTEVAWSGSEFQDWCRLWAAECLRVLKPGGHLLAFGGTRTAHRLTAGIEDAGFEVRDSIAWLYGSGFPKSLDVSKAIDKRGGNAHLAGEIAAAIKRAREDRGWTTGQADRHFCGGSTNWTWYEGRKGMCRPPTPADFARIVHEWPELAPLADLVAEADREVTGKAAWNNSVNHFVPGAGHTHRVQLDVTAPATDDARKWQGWGTALKPSHEPVVVARKPLSGTVAATVLEWGTGALNIDASRVASDEPIANHHGTNGAAGVTYGNRREYVPGSAGPQNTQTAGRWPPNVVLDGAAADELDQQSGWSDSSVGGQHSGRAGTRDDVGAFGYDRAQINRPSDAGGASRFFPTFRYEPKAGSAERPRVTAAATEQGHPHSLGYNQVRCAGCDVPQIPGNCECPDGPEWVKATSDQVAHPTVKPLGLMRWLVKLVTPPGGTVLEPFAGSGTTAEACVIEGFKCIAIERDETYLPLIVARLSKPIQVALDFDGEAS